MSSQEFVEKCPCTPGSNCNLEMLAYEEKVNWSTRKKNSQNRAENQQQTRPTYDAGSWNRTHIDGRQALSPLRHPHLCPRSLRLFMEG